MNFHITGANKNTGKDVSFTVEAADEAAALEAAYSRDILVSTVSVVFAARPASPTTGVGDWILNPGDSFPLTIVQVEKRLIPELRALLAQTEEVHASGLFDSVAAMVAQRVLRCKEIEDYVNEYRAQFDAGKKLSVVPYCDLESLFNGNKVDGALGAGLVVKYGFWNLRFYCRHAKMLDTPRPIAKTHRDRARFEELVRAGLARMGSPITQGGKSGEAFSLMTIEGTPGFADLASWLRYCETIGELLMVDLVNALATG